MATNISNEALPTRKRDPDTSCHVVGISTIAIGAPQLKQEIHVKGPLGDADMRQNGLDRVPRQQLGTALGIRNPQTEHQPHQGVEQSPKARRRLKVVGH